METPKTAPIIGERGNVLTLNAQEKSTIGRKLVRVQSGLGAIEKRGRNAHYGYNYYKLEDILAALNPLLNAEGLVISHSITGKDFSIGNGIVFIETQHTILDADSGETITVHFCGTGKDEKKKAVQRAGVASEPEGIGDKAIYKAMTTAVRYFYMETFRISEETEDNDFAVETESQTEASKTPSQAPKPSTHTQASPKPQKPLIGYSITRQISLMPSELKADIATINQYQPPNFTDAQSQRLIAAAEEKFRKEFGDMADEIAGFLFDGVVIESLTTQELYYITEWLRRNEAGELRATTKNEIAMLIEKLSVVTHG